MAGFDQNISGSYKKFAIIFKTLETEDQEDVSVIKRTSLAENLGFVSSMDMIVHATCNSI